MSVFTRICTGLLISTLSLSAQAAQPETEGQTPVQEPSQPTVDVSSTAEVIQVLHVGVASEVQIINLIREKNPDAELQAFVDQLSQDLVLLSGKLQELATSKSVALESEQMTENARAIESQMKQEVEVLSQAAPEMFRSAAIAALVNKYQQALDLYVQVEQSSMDEELKAAVALFRPGTQKHLQDAQELQKPSEEPTPAE
jgi:pantothenate kinase-related protein Tda10